MSEKKNVPEIRFPGFPDDWEQRKLSEILEIATRKNGNQYTKQDVLSVSDEFGCVNQIRFQGRSFAGEDISNYKVVKTGDIIYTRSPLQAKPFGIIKIVGEETGIISPLYIVNVTTEGNDPKFIYYCFDTPQKTNNYLSPLVRKGAKNTMNISNDEWLSGEIIVSPYYEEQKRIAEFLTRVDGLITLHQRKCDKLQELKKGLLQKMFPKNGESVPEIRFPGFTGAWEQRKYSDFIHLLSGQDFEPSEYNAEGYGIPYLTGASCVENGKTIVNRWTTNPKCIAEKGDVLLVCKGSGCGTIAVMAQDSAHIARQFMALKCKDELDEVFNYYLANTVVDEIKKDVRGLIAGIARDAVLRTIVNIPTLQEQKKIGVYFSQLDNLITLHQRECEKWKKLKDGLLQKMFI